MNASTGIELIRQAANDFVARISEVASNFQPRGGQPFKPEVSALLSGEVSATPKDILSLVADLRQPPKNAVALDFGCGSCPHKAKILASGYKYVGVDYDASIDPSRIARLAMPEENQVVQYDGLGLPFKDGEFDLVWSWHSLEHCISPEKSFKEIARVLKPSGILAGGVPSLVPYHAESVVNYTPYGFTLFCERAGLKVVKIIPNLDAMSFFLKNLMLSLGIGETADQVGNAFRSKPFIEPFLQRFRDLGHVVRIPLELHAELCAEFGFIAIKD
jgi:SAM-dependent methyltransferase